MEHILIVEDEEFLMRALKDNLEMEKYSVDTAVDGEDAIKKIQKKMPNIILLDLLMPKYDGFYALEKIRENSQWKQIIVIVLSNLGGDQEIKRAIALGANDFFVKSQHPIEEIIQKVKEHLAKRN
jgi:two-component system response regulator VicR